MAAKNPFRVSDLIAKYGWKIMPYLSNLGPQLLAEAQVLFVDSGHTNALDADDTEHGHSFEKPLATIDYAIDLCTAGERSVIFVAPGHNEELADEQVDFDVSDITIIGIGEGTNRPRIDFDHANSSVLIGANNIHLINLVLMPAITDILIGIEVEATVTGTIFEKCHFAEGENAPDEFILGVDVKAGCDNTKFINCTGRTKVTSAGAVAAVKFTGASDNCIVEKCRFIGNYSTAAIVNDTGACTDLLIDDLTCKVADGEPGIEVHTNCTGIIRNVCIESTGTTVDNMIVADSMSWFNNFGVTADGTAAEIIGGGEVQAALDTTITSPTGGSLRDILHKDGNHTYNNTTDSLEALSETIGLISAPTDTTAAVPDTPTGNSLQDILSELDGENTYDNTTDSLEAISNFLRTGATLGRGINLDYFMKTAVTDEQDMSAEIATGSALAHILVKAPSGDVDDFDPTTDSLEAIADAVTGFTTAVSTTPTARSVQDILEKDTNGNFDDAEDSLEMISDKAGAFAGTSGAGQSESVKASLDLAHTDLDAILADTISISGATLPSGGPTANSLARFIASGGSALGQQLPASMSLIDIIGDYSGAYDGSSAGNNIKADIDLLTAVVATGATFGGGIQLDHLLKTTTGQTLDQTLATYIADFSVMAHVMSATAVGSTFRASTDSLEAIAAALLAGTGATVAIDADSLDKLVGTSDTNQAFPASIVDHSIMSAIMTSDGDHTGYDRATDSLEAIADLLLTGTPLVGIGLDTLCAVDTTVAVDGDLEDHAVQGSLMAHIMSVSKDATTYKCSTDSLEAISNKVSAVDAVVDMGTQTLKVAAVDITGGDVDVFTIATGPVKIRSLFFIIATATDVNSKAGFSCTPTAGSETDLTPTVGSGVELNGAADAGDIVYSEMDNTIMIIADTDGTDIPKVPEFSQIVPIGSINLVMENAGPNNGIVDVYVQWEPLAPGATLTATP